MVKGFKNFVGLSVVCLIVLVSNVSAEETYKIDPVHSTIGFAVKHILVSTTRGVFTDYSGEIQFDKEALDTFKADVTIQVSSIETNNEKRNGHLLNSDFFDAEKYPVITFNSNEIHKISGAYEIVGDFTMHGITKEISIPMFISGPIQHPKGGNLIGLAGEFVINRQDYGVSWNKNLDKGGVMISDDVKILIEIEAKKN